MKVAFGLFGFIRTYERTYKSLNKVLKDVDADLYIHTWDYTDNLNSWHGLNSEPQKTRKYLARLKSIYNHNLVDFNITSQDDMLNCLVFTDYIGRNGIIGHQYHMWLSVLNVLKLAYSKSNYDFVVITRPDIKIKLPKSVFESCYKNKFNFAFKYINKDLPFSFNNITVYDLVFIVDKSFIVAIEKLLENIINTNCIVSQENFFFKFLDEIGYEINPIINEELNFKIIRPYKPYLTKIVKKLLNLIYKTA
jgi:hypothetical protein